MTKDKGPSLPIHVGVVAASSAVPMVELNRGLDVLRAHGFDVRLHDQCAQQHFTFAGNDDQRARAFWEYANDPALDVLWLARGGYGATRLLPLLEALTREQGIPPRKLLVGYSDATVLHELVRTRWNWPTLHAPMPAAANFGQYDPVHFSALLAYVRKPRPPTPWLDPLRFLVNPPAAPIHGKLVGGNLTLWQCLAGTPWFPRRSGNLLFFEDLNEPWYRVDRMVTQLLQAGAFDGADALILGDFTDCTDDVLTGLVSLDSAEKIPLRKRYEKDEALHEIFGTLGQKLAIPVATGLPVGHGPGFAPLPLGATYSLTPEGSLELVRWEWLGE